MSNSLAPVAIYAIGFFVVMPILKALWEFLTRAPKPKIVLDTEPGFQREMSIQAFGNPESEVLTWWQARTSRFIAIESPGDLIVFYSPDDVPMQVRSAIIAGRHPTGAKVHVFSKGPDGKWNATETTLRQFAESTFKLRVLYCPVWSCAMAGVKWGILAGIAFKLLDTAIALFAVAPGAGLCFLAAVAVCLVPRVGVIGMVIISVIMGQFYRGNFFMMGLSAGLVGAVLGVLPGMAFGGLVGLAKRSYLPHVPDVALENGSIWFKAAVLPLIGAVALFEFYFRVFNPWLVSALSHN